MTTATTTRTARIVRVLAVLAVACGVSLAVPHPASADEADGADGDVSVQYEHTEVVAGWWACEVRRAEFSEWAWVDPYCQEWGLEAGKWYFTWTCRIC